MNWDKAKNIIILLLALVNIFLIGNLAYMRLSGSSDARNTETELKEYLSGLGIELENGVLPSGYGDRKEYIIERRTEDEDSAAYALIGDGKKAFTGGVSVYAGDGGRLTWRYGGLIDGSIDVLGNDVEALFSSAGFVASKTVDQDGEYLLVEDFFGLPVYNCTLSATPGDDGYDVSGRWYFGSPLTVGEDMEQGAVGLVVRFAVNAVRQGAQISEINAMDPGYLAFTVTNVGIKLTPVFLMDTDAGEFYISAMDGSILTAE